MLVQMRYYLFLLLLYLLFSLLLLPYPDVLLNHLHLVSLVPHWLHYLLAWVTVPMLVQRRYYIYLLPLLPHLYVLLNCLCSISLSSVAVPPPSPITFPTSSNTSHSSVTSSYSWCASSIVTDVLWNYCKILIFCLFAGIAEKCPNL